MTYSLKEVREPKLITKGWDSETTNLNAGKDTQLFQKFSVLTQDACVFNLIQSQLPKDPSTTSVKVTLTKKLIKIKVGDKESIFSIHLTRPGMKATEQAVAAIFAEARRQRSIPQSLDTDLANPVSQPPTKQRQGKRNWSEFISTPTPTASQGPQPMSIRSTNKSRSNFVIASPTPDRESPYTPVKRFTPSNSPNSGFSTLSVEPQIAKELPKFKSKKHIKKQSRKKKAEHSLSALSVETPKLNWRQKFLSWWHSAPKEKPKAPSQRSPTQLRLPKIDSESEIDVLRRNQTIQELQLDDSPTPSPIQKRILRTTPSPSPLIPENFGLQFEKLDSPY